MEEKSEGRHVIIPEPDHDHDQVKIIVQLLSAVLDLESLWPEGSNDFSNQLKQMKKTLEDVSNNELKGDDMMIDTSSKTKV